MNRIIASLIVICPAFVVAPLAASAAPITVPTDLNVGDKYRLAFVTSTTRDATSSDIADYNAFVTAVATGVTELAALGTTWKAIGSTVSVAARDNTGTNPSSTGVPIYRVDDVRIADDNADLWDFAIAAPLSVLESGLASGSTSVWTGTLSDGLPLPGLELGATPNVIRGDQTTADADWLGDVASLTILFKPLYAMSGELTVVPEPGAMTLVCIGATAVVGWQLRRRRRRHHKP